MIAIIILATPLFSSAQSSYADERVVVALVTEDRAELPWIDLFEVSLANDTRIDLVDRDHLDDVIAEQQLSRLMGPVDGPARIRLGELVGCDLLLMVRHESEPRSLIRVVVADTRSGIRLINSTFPAKVLEQSEGLAAELLSSALAKRRIAQPIILAIPPFANNDLTLENDALQDSLATICESVATRNPRVVLVELEEAREIAKENRLTGRQVSRGLPHYLVGSFRLESNNIQQPPYVSLKLERGDKVVAKQRLDSADPEAFGTFAQQATNILMRSVADEATTEVSAASEARVLAEQASKFLRVGDFARGAKLAEASLLLRDEQFDLHHNLIGVYAKLARLQYDDSRMSKERFKKQFDRAAAFAVLSLEHKEVFLNSADVKPYQQILRNPDLNHFQNHRHSTPEIIARIAQHQRNDREVYVGKLLAESERGALNEITLSWLLRSALGHYTQKMEGELSAFLKTRARMLPVVESLPEPRRGPHYLRILTQGLPYFHDDIQEWYRSFMSAPDQRLVNAAKRAFETSEGHKARSSGLALRWKPSPPQRDPDVQRSDVRVKLTPTEIAFSDKSRQTEIHLQGVLGDSRGHEIAWGFHGPRVVLKRSDGDSFQKIYGADNQHSFGTACFDGKYVWLPIGGNQAELLRIDPASGDVVTVSAEHGLPVTKNYIAIAAPIKPGCVALVGVFGQHFARRSFVAVVSWESKSGAHVRIVHEARENVADRASLEIPGANDQNTTLAYFPKFVLPLRLDGSQTPTHLLIGRSVPGSSSGTPGALVVNLESGKASVWPIHVHSHISPRDIVIHDNQAYWVAFKKVWRVGTDPDQSRQAIADVSEGHGAIFIQPDGILVIGNRCWYADDWDQQFSRVGSNVQRFMQSHLNQAYYGGPSGALLKTNQKGWKLLQVEIDRTDTLDH